MDISEFIVNNSQRSVNENQTNEYYTLFGNHDYLDKNKNPRVDKDEDKVLAKAINYSHRTKYFLKIGDHGKLYNPMGLYSEGTSEKFLSKIGRKAWQFKEVSLSAFDLYVKFLKTKNTAWLRNAERELE